MRSRPRVSQRAKRLKQLAATRAGTAGPRQVLWWGRAAGAQHHVQLIARAGNDRAVGLTWEMRRRAGKSAPFDVIRQLPKLADQIRGNGTVLLRYRAGFAIDLNGEPEFFRGAGPCWFSPW